jgi:hypothetical protein
MDLPLTEGRFWNLQLLLGLASAVFLWSVSHVRRHILLSQLWESPNLESQIPVYISPSERIPQFYQSQSYLTTDGQSASLSWYQASICQLRRISFLFLGNYLDICGFSILCAHSDERVCLLRLLLGLTSAVCLGPESRDTYDHTLLSPFWDSPNLYGQFLVFLTPRTR